MNKIIRLWTMLCAVLGSSPSVTAADPGGYVDRPSCGTASVVGWLAIVDISAKVSDVASKFERIENGGSSGSVSATDIVSVLGDYGVASEVQRWPRWSSS
ncbi:MAG: hypothetical protein ABL931_17735, partial [Usitatibacteraceae bacterium]